MKSVKDYIISIPDFPSKGIIFRDVTSVLESPEIHIWSATCLYE